jgi:hypothetical protein
MRDYGGGPESDDQPEAFWRWLESVHRKFVDDMTLKADALDARRCATCGGNGLRVGPA